MQRTTATLTGGQASEKRAGRRRSGMFGRREPVELLLDLTSIRRRLGDKWDKVAPAVRRFASHVIERHVGDRATYELNGNAFTIHFTGVPQGEAASMLHAIRSDLEELLFGSGDVEEERPRATRRSSHRPRRRLRFPRWLARLGDLVPFRFGANGRRVSSARHRASTLDAESVAEHLAGFASVGETEPPAGGDGRPDGAPSAARFRGTAVSRGYTRRLAPDTPSTRGASESPPPAPASIAEPAALEPSSVAPEPGGPADSAWWSTDATPERTAAGRGGGAAHTATGRPSATPSVADGAGERAGEPTAPGSSRTAGRVRRTETDALERALFLAIQEAERQKQMAQQARLFPPMGTRILYRPMWLVERGVVPIYSCTPACALGPFEFATGEALIGKNIGARKIAMLDEMLMDHIANDLRPRLSTQLRTIVCIPVHYETITGDRAEPWMETLRSIPDRIRLNVMVEIIGISQGVGQLATYSLVRKLKSHVRDVIGRLELGDANFRIWRETDLGCVGVDLETDNRPELDVITDLNNFVAPAKQHGMRTFARGIRSLSLAAAAVASGLDYLDGPAIAEGDLVLKPQPTPFGVFDIYRT